MPYTKQSDRDSVRASLRNVRTVGDINFFFTLMILKAWNDRPKYSTYHGLKKDLQTDPKNSQLVQLVRRELCDGFHVSDIYTAADAAMVEFERRVVRAYEKSKIEENGDVPEYVQALKAIKDGYKSPALPAIPYE